MFVGKVIGTVWSTVKWPEVQGLKLLVVRPYHLADLADLSHLAKVGDLGELSDLSDRAGPDLANNPASSPSSAAPDTSPRPGGGPDCEAVVCVDLLDAGVGDDVVVAFGHAARVAAQMEGSQMDGGQKTLGGRQNGGNARNTAAADPHQKLGISASQISSAIVPIDAAVVAIVDSIEVSRPTA